MYKLLEILEERYLVSILAIEQILIVVKDLSLQSISEVPTFKLYVKSNFKHLPSEYELSIKENSDVKYFIFFFQIIDLLIFRNF